MRSAKDERTTAAANNLRFVIFGLRRVRIRSQCLCVVNITANDSASNVLPWYPENSQTKHRRATLTLHDSSFCAHV